MLKLSVVLIFALTFLGQTFASSNVWRVNQDHSELFFKVPYLTLSHVTGQFTRYTGRISFNEKQSFPTNIRLKIESSSIFTGNKIRDGHLKSKDFFHSKKYPSLTFISDNIIANKSGNYDVWGFLTIADHKKRIKVLMNVSQVTSDSWKYENRFISFKTQINRSEFNLTWNKTLKNDKYLIGNKIDIWGNFQVQPLNKVTPTHKYMIPNTKYTKLKDKLTLGDISLQQFKQELELNYKKSTKKTKSYIDKNKQDNSTVDSHPTLVTKNRITHVQQTSTWWFAYYVMGFIGLVAMIIIALQGKYLFIKIWPQHYKENSLLGILSDLLAYFVAFIYVWAMWILAYN